MTAQDPFTHYGLSQQSTVKLVRVIYMGQVEEWNLGGEGWHSPASQKEK
jgi:hypothetical protein